MSSLSSLPEEFYQMITEKLDYKDAWSLKQTSRHFARVIEIPTYRSFQRHLWQSKRIKSCERLKQAKKTQIHSLKTLIQAGVFPFNQAICRFCYDILGLAYFDEDQQAIRREKVDFEAIANMYCLSCGAENNLYKPGDHIYCDFTPMLDPYQDDFPDNEMTLCFSCLRFIRYEGFDDGKAWYGPCQFCKACVSCMRLSNAILNNGSVKRNSQSCQHVETLGAKPDRTRRQQRSNGSFSRFPEKLLWHFFEQLDYPSSWALAQTSHFFYSSMFVTTVRNFFDRRAWFSLYLVEGLAALRDWNIIPFNAQPCIYCKQFRAPQPGKIYYWKPLAYIDANPESDRLDNQFRWCYDCSCNHGSTNGCFNTQDIYTPCPDCLCCDKCMELVEQTLELKRVPNGIRERDLQNGRTSGCDYCKSKLTERGGLENLRSNGCKEFSWMDSPLSPLSMTESLLEGQEVRKPDGRKPLRRRKRRHSDQASGERSRGVAIASTQKFSTCCSTRHWNRGSTSLECCEIGWDAMQLDHLSGTRMKRFEEGRWAYLVKSASILPSLAKPKVIPFT